MRVTTRQSPCLIVAIIPTLTDKHLSSDRNMATDLLQLHGNIGRPSLVFGRRCAMLFITTSHTENSVVLSRPVNFYYWFNHNYLITHFGSLQNNRRHPALNTYSTTMRLIHACDTMDKQHHHLIRLACLRTRNKNAHTTTPLSRPFVPRDALLVLPHFQQP